MHGLWRTAAVGVTITIGVCRNDFPGTMVEHVRTMSENTNTNNKVPYTPRLRIRVEGGEGGHHTPCDCGISLEWRSTDFRQMCDSCQSNVYRTSTPIEPHTSRTCTEHLSSLSKVYRTSHAQVSKWSAASPQICLLGSPTPMPPLSMVRCLVRLVCILRIFILRVIHKTLKIFKNIGY